MVFLYLTAAAFLQASVLKQHAPVNADNKWAPDIRTRVFGTTRNANSIDTDFLALGLGGTNMMMMLWSVAMGKRAAGVEMRGDPFLFIHWNIRVDLYHQLGLIDNMMMERYGEEGVPHRANGDIFSLADCFYSPKTTAGYVVGDEVISGYDKIHHLVGTIHHLEFIDDRYKDGKPNRVVSTLPRPEPPEKPDPNAIRSSMREVLDGPSTFQSEANNILVLLRRYLEAIVAMDEESGREARVQLFTRHQVCSTDDGFVRKKDGRVAVNLEAVQELDFKGKLSRVPIPNSPRIKINAPELCVIAQGVNSQDAKRLGFTQMDVAVDHKDGRGPLVAQADYLAGFIDVLVDGRIRRRIASAFDEDGREYWVRQIAVGHEGDPQVGWLLVQVPDFMVFDPVKAGYVKEGVDKDSVEYFAAYQRLLYEFYIQECSKILEIPEDELKGVRMAYGPKLFSMVERIGHDPRVAPNVVVAGDSFGNGHFLTSGGAMAGMVGHSMGVLNFWKARDEGVSLEEAYKTLAENIKKGTKDWLEGSAKEFSQFTPVNFGIDRINAVAEDSHIDVDARAEHIDASRRMRHELSVQDPFDWRRPAIRNGKVYTADLLPPRKQLRMQ
eukprot:CAMPEP_0197438106 /NCGR_PEP_ID=MMETSP1175-20131217/5191_1 /TAXON_ID=1003142 /ORGANISM="Triceratium dubium, Strain CCMP147" /LENGTH=608 /DNA_ID=CAMNT_0042967773 /DNA_START=30 /DNA_END=1856 /DNA_ORIENTATION=-